jgi:tetratricopeptide (TPR) repeat protein
MTLPHRPALRRTALAIAAAGLAVGSLTGAAPAPEPFDPLFADSGRACGPLASGQPGVLKMLVRVAAKKSETAPFQPQAMQAAGGDVPLYTDLGRLSLKVGTGVPRAQAYFDQGLRLAFAFNHAEAQRAFRRAQQLDPNCAMCFWGEALVLGPNINAPMMPEAVEPALAALGRAVALKAKAPPKDRALVEALQQRYSADPKVERPALDAAYADAMKAVAAQYPRDDTVLALAAEAAMDAQPWDYWEPGGAKAKGRGADIVALLETVLKRNPTHPGAIHLYIHAVEASTAPERALPYADRLSRLMPGAGHVVHMPAHIYYRVGQYRRSLELNKKAIAVDERYFKTSPSDPLYRSAYYPHNIHFVMVSAQMGGDAQTALDAAAKLDASMPVDVVKSFPVMEPVKAAPYSTHAQFAAPERTLALPRPDPALVLVTAHYHYARAVAFAQQKDAAAAQREIDAIAKLEASADFKPFEPWGVPAKEIVQTAKLVAQGRLADARGDLDGAAKAYEDAVSIEDALAYMEPPFWYYPVRQSLGAVRLRQGRLDDAERAFRDSLAKVRNNGWALAGLAEVYRLKGDKASERSTRSAYARTWFGGSGGPDLARL